MSNTHDNLDGIAIIGMAGRFPGAKNIHEFWQILKDGKETIRTLSHEELRDEELDYDAVKDDPDYIRARGTLDGIDQFDAGFFGFTPREAAALDPQHRIWLECAWEALETAGYDSEKYDGSIGVFAGTYINSYLLNNLCKDRAYIDKLVRFRAVDAFQNIISNDKDYLPTRTAYKFNLTGPAINVQTACSSSLVAVCQAVQSLLNYESDLCLAGGITITVPQNRGYLSQEGGMLSTDGHCRPFDAKASGTVFSNGAGVVVLKRLEDAVKDNDLIYAVIKGAALNNDGANKVSYSAPSVDGQAQVIAMAQAFAGFSPESIGYIEAHGTATPLGDPIEITGLTKAFRAGTDKKGFCGIGSVKSNIGHLDSAAGVAGLIKTALALHHRQIPPTLHFETPNPEIDFENSPFRVVDQLQNWERNGSPRRAGVSSFGVGGTNAHVVLEEAPKPVQSSDSRPWQLVTLSAKTESALKNASTNLTDFMAKYPQVNLADAAFTLNSGRRDMAHRQIFVTETLSGFKNSGKVSITKAHCTTSEPSVVFMFPGQGAQHVNMGRGLYETEKVLRETVDQCLEILKSRCDLDLRPVLFPISGGEEEAAQKLKQTALTQPALFVIEYALARQWMHWGVQPDAMIGHSVGEYVAACLAGVFSLEDALTILTARAKMMQEQPQGGMLAVRLSEKDLSPWVQNGVVLAAVNAPQMCVLSGAHDHLEAVKTELEAKGVSVQPLHTSHAFHSKMMEPVFQPFAEKVAQAKLEKPSIPFISSLTGKWITDDEARNPEYWAKQLRFTVRFSDGVRELQKEPNRIYLEIGPGKTLSALAMQHSQKDGKLTAISSLGHVKESKPDAANLLAALGSAWLNGVKIDWQAFYENETRRRIPLPTYPFERKRYWVDAPKMESPTTSATTPSSHSRAGGNPVSVVEPVDSRLSGNDVTNVVSEPAISTTAPSIPFEGGMTGRSATEISTNVPIPVANGTHAPTIDLETEKPNETRTMNSTGSAEQPRTERILAKLREIIYELSGIEMEPGDEENSFMEMGLDSLFLTQASSEFQEQFDIKITFRQLLEDLDSLQALANYLDEKLPSSAFAPPPPPIESTPAPQPQSTAMQAEAIPVAPSVVQAPASVSMPQMQLGTPVDGSLQNLIQQQMDLMSRQLALLQNGAPAAAPPVVQEQQNKSPRAQEDDLRLPDAPAKKSGAKANTGRFGPYKTIEKAKDGGLTERQQKHLDSLIQKLTAKTKRSKELAQQNRPVQADPRSVAGFRLLWKELVYQIATERSQGCNLWDVDGNEYVDITMCFGANLLGYSPPFVIEAAKKQLEKGVEIGPQSPLAGDVARLVRQLTDMERVSFCNTGSEAVMAAIRMARTVTGRTRFAFFSGDYHGIFDDVLARQQTMRGKMHTAPAAPGIPQSSVKNNLVLDYGKPESLEIIKEFAGELAAVLVEPVQSRHPDVQPREFLHELRKITEENNIALIFDEVITGFRVHPGGAQAWFDVRADLASYGKIAGGGMPCGVVAGSAKFMDSLDGGMWQYGDDSLPEADVTFFAGTFVRHPLALAAGKAVLEHLIEQGGSLQENLNQKTADFAAEMNAFFTECGVPIRVLHFSSWFRFDYPYDLTYAQLLFYHLVEKGVYIREAGQNCFFCTAHTDADIAFVARAIKESVIELQKAGFLPGPDDGGGSGGASIEKKTQKRTPSEPVTESKETPSTSFPRRRESSGAPLIDSRLRGNDVLLESGRFPLTAAQKEIWLAARIGEDAACAHNEAFLLTLNGELNFSALQKAVREVLPRHESLHLRFDKNGEFQRAESLDPEKIELPFTDISETEASARKTELDKIIRRESLVPFDLENGPLFRLLLVKLDAQEHVFIFLTNHIVCDGWSTGVLLDEISVVYSAICKNEPVELSPATPFREFAALQTADKNSEARQSALDFWLNHLKNPPAPLDLPTDHPRGIQKSHRGHTIKMTIRPEIYQSIKKAAAREKATLFAAVLAAFKVFLYRLSKQDDLVVGMPAAGQAMTGMHTLVGHCVNLLPLRSKLDGEASFSEFLKQVKTSVLDAYDHFDCTVGEILPHLKIERRPGRSPLVEILFNLDRDSAGQGFHGLEAHIAQAPKESVHFDIFMNLNEMADGLIVDCDYNADLFEEATMRVWLRSFEALLENIAHDTSASLNSFSMLGEDDLNTILYQWNDTQRDFDKTLKLHDLVEQQATKTPEATAVIGEDRSFSYQELLDRADNFAKLLSENGVKKGGLVGVYCERSAEVVAALLGVMKIGAAYVPLDPSFPPARLQFMIDDAQISALVTNLDRVDLKTPDHAPIIHLSEISSRETQDIELAFNEAVEQISSFPRRRESRSGAPLDSRLRGNDVEAAVKRPTTATDLVYVIYTSGSTGKPKGVQIPHSAAVNFMLAMQEKPGLHEGDRLLSVTTLSFDISVLEIFLPLTCGATTILADKQTVSDGKLLAEMMVKHQANVMQATPATWRLLLESGWQNATLKKALCGGEAMPADLRDALLDQNLELWNMYGPTETTIWSSVMKIDSKDEPILIGKPIANTQMYILDENRQPAPVGVPGELYIAGDGLATGYLNRPELTAEKFINTKIQGLNTNNQSLNTKHRVYRTGDLARYRADGNIECLGRTDFQIKIRGFRIEAGEIEAKLQEIAGVKQAVVNAAPDASGTQTLVAYLVCENEAPQPADLRAHLRKDLPPYMIPARFIFVGEMPLTPNGKIDRKALPAPGFEGNANGELNGKVHANGKPHENGFLRDKPREKLFQRGKRNGHAGDLLEMQLLKTWESLLGVKNIGMDDDFFELGGHSLLAARLFAKIEDSHGVALPLATLFQDSTVAALAQVIRRNKGKSSWSSLVPIQAGGSRTPLFLIHGAEGNVLLYRDLARKLGEDQPVFGLQAQGLDGKTPPLTTIEEMAELYLKEIRALQPEGPYALGGYCMGGTIAYEIAQRLVHDGERVSLLALLETYNVHGLKDYSLAGKTRLGWQNLRFHAENVLKLPAGEKKKFLETKTSTAKERMKMRFQSGFTKAARGLSRNGNGAFPHLALAKINDHAQEAYTPSPYPGKITLFRPNRLFSGMEDPQFGWGALARDGVDVHQLPFAPRGMLVEPFVRQLADKLKKSLAGVREEVSPAYAGF